MCKQSLHLPSLLKGSTLLHSLTLTLGKGSAKLFWVRLKLGLFASVPPKAYETIGSNFYKIGIGVGWGGIGWSISVSYVLRGRDCCLACSLASEGSRNEGWTVWGWSGTWLPEGSSRGRGHLEADPSSRILNSPAGLGYVNGEVDLARQFPTENWGICHPRVSPKLREVISFWRWTALS